MLKKVALLTFGQGINVLISILFLPYMSRSLNYLDYGTYGQVILIVSSFGILLNWGLPQIFNVYLADPRNNLKDTLSNNLATGLISSLLGFFILFYTADYFGLFFENNLLSDYIKIYSLSLIFTIPFNSFNTYLIFQGKARKSVYYSIFPNLLKVILVIFSIQYFHSLTLVFISMVITSAIQLITGLYTERSMLSKHISRQQMYNQFKDGLPLGITSIVAMLFLYTDGVMVSKMLGIKEYAIFRNGAFEVPFLASIYGSIAAIVMPEISKLWHKNEIDNIVELKRKVILNTVVILYPILAFLMVNSQEIVVIYFGSAYALSASVFAIYNLTLLVRVNDYLDVLTSAKKGNIILLSNVTALIINIFLNYFLIQYFGTLGAALSTVISLFVLIIILLFFTNQQIDKKIFRMLALDRVFLIFFISISLQLIIRFILSKFNLNGITLIISNGVVFFSLIYLLLYFFDLIDSTLLLKLRSFKNKIGIK